MGGRKLKKDGRTDGWMGVKEIILLPESLKGEWVFEEGSAVWVFCITGVKNYEIFNKFS